jgi:glycosyl transferase family 25
VDSAAGHEYPEVCKTGSGLTQMKCYVINLDRSSERLVHLSNALSGTTVDVVRVAAVDGDRLAELDFRHWQSLAKVWAPLTRGQVACFLSHRKAWEIIIEQGEPWAFICEDDIHIAGDFGNFFADYSWIPEDSDVVKAETMSLQIEMSAVLVKYAFGHQLRILKSEHFGSAGYFLSREAAKRLIELTSDHCEPVDCILFSPRGPVASLLTVYQLDPAICIQDFHLAREGKGIGFSSDIPLRTSKQKPSGWREKSVKLSRELQRPLRQFGALLRRVFLTLLGKSVFRAVRIDLLEK